MGSSDVEVVVQDGIGTIFISREEKYNSFRWQTYTDLMQALQSLAYRKDTFITVLTGKGKFFSSGADITEEREAPKDRHDAWVKFRTALEFSTAALTRAVIDHPKPLVVLLNGPVIGYPAGLIGNADIIYASESAYLYCPFSSLALCAEGNSSHAFVQRMGLGPANEALLLGKKFNARELEKLGFVNQTFPAASFAAETSKILAQAVATCHPESLVVTKRLIRSAFVDQQYKTLMHETDALTERYMSGEPAVAFGRLMKRNAAKNKL
ncbi:ClpP/crotonase-like domain-containing protein [Fimicolochytrium jonesii]|uniref:ClpP/crotonase-like domain-containing protein n=1 Tax=Fimicolochytrium jonesii TaxID=1396493 RepID=UPI0022FE7869|nr:ClpP/crotonase-like domain-containing protein [Fimicolochytrium jonesii]KAI8816041.1 ClpP/crotonase-like domain-containing protein [Fimicolochytrium jonesii]